jgi:hypothetical protein
MIASLSVAATVHYLPRPAQQGSAPQIGVEKGDVDPAGNQQQQPLQSVHVAVWGSGWHTAAHASLAAPLLLSLSPLEGPLVPVVLLPQAASPPVDDAPMTTMTWKSFSMFMKHICRPRRGSYIRRAFTETSRQCDSAPKANLLGVVIVPSHRRLFSLRSSRPGSSSWFWGCWRGTDDGGGVSVMQHTSSE